MIDLDHLSKLLAILNANQVHSYKNQGLEVLFHVERKPAKMAYVDDHADAKPQGPGLAEHSEHNIQEVPIDETQLPVDLRSDAITDHDKVLFYSASPDPQEAPLPGTGETAL